MSKEFRCPTCGTDLTEHGAGECLDAWVESQRVEQAMYYPDYSTDYAAAWTLMREVWRMKEYITVIGNEYIEITPHSNGLAHFQIGGPTFPVRVCRAYVFLKLGGK